MGILDKEGFTAKAAGTPDNLETNSPVLSEESSQLPSSSSKAGTLLSGSSEDAHGAGSELESVSERGGQAQQFQALVGIMESREGCVTCLIPPCSPAVLIQIEGGTMDAGFPGGY